MQATFATDPGSPGRPNEDYAVCGLDWAVILDGATAPAAVDSGCVHDVPWLVRHLAAGIVHGLMLGNAPLPDVLAEAIRMTCEAHEGTCDLGNPDSPSSTAAIIRSRGGVLDYLVLGDSDVILRCGRDILPVHDDRTEHLPGGRPYSSELVRQCRNAPGGFWIASTRPDAAYEAISGSAEGVSDVALLTDGVARLRDWYGWDSRAMLDALRYQGGPSGLIRRVREAERASGVPFGKRHDDATVIWASGIGCGAGATVVPDPFVMVR
jgi:Protein phosphatase 2C